MAAKKGAISATDVEAKVAALAALRKIPGRGPIPQFIAALRDPDLPAAKTAAMGLCDRKAILAPLRELLGDADPAMRWRACALAWFFMIRDFVPDLIRALRDPDRMVRTEAAWAMRSADSDDAARALLRAVRDGDGMVAHYAAWTLRRILRPRCPQLPSLKGARIPELPLRAERRRRARRPAGAVADDARAFDQFACSAKLPVYRAPLTSAPRTNGRRDACYRRAKAATLAHIDGYPAPPLRKTDFSVVCSADALHFFIRCRYRGRNELKARHTTYGSSVHADNSIEIFLEPAGRGRPPYFQICLNTRNARCDLRHSLLPGHTWRPGSAGEEPPWRPKRIETAVQIKKDCWNAELAIPFADLGLSGGKVNKLWRMNVVRNTRAGGGRRGAAAGGQAEELSETTSWVNMGEHDAHRPERFGYLWVDAGEVVNADGETFRQVPLPIRRGLAGWTVLRGRCRASEGEVMPVGGSAVLRWDQPIDFESFEVAGEAQIRQQIRYLFSPGPANAQVSFMAAYINPINEINIAGARNWEHWAPPYPGHLSIFKEVYPRLTHSRWYDVAVRVRPDRLQCLLDGAVHMELPNPRPGVRFFGLGLVGGGRVRKLRIRPLE